MGPGAARLGVQVPVVVGDVLGVEDAGAVLQRIALGEVLGDEGGVDGTVDDDVRDVDALRPELARQALRQRAQRMLGAGEGGKAGTAGRRIG